jgi:hypothetical protein
MSYTPNNVQVYSAAFTGCVAGMMSGRRLFNTSIPSYLDVMRVADAWAQEVDGLWAGTPTLLDIDNISGISVAEFIGRFPNPAVEPASVIPATFATQAMALMAEVSAAQLRYATEGITPPPLPGGGGTPATPNSSVQFDNTGAFGGAAFVGISGTGDLTVGAAPLAAGLAATGSIRSVLATGTDGSNGYRVRNHAGTNDLGAMQYFFDGIEQVLLFGTWTIPNAFGNPVPAKTFDSIVFAANSFEQWATSDDGTHGVGSMFLNSPAANATEYLSLDLDLAGRFFFHANSRGTLSNTAMSATDTLGETDRMILGGKTAGAAVVDLVDTSGAELTLPDNSNMCLRLSIVGSRTDAQGGGRTTFDVYVRTHGGAVTLIGNPLQETPDGAALSTLVDAGLAVAFSTPGGLVFRIACTGIAAQNYRFAANIEVRFTGGF